MARILKAALMLLVLLTFYSPALAKSSWQVTKVSQPAFFSLNGKNWQAVKKGMLLANHTWIKTKSRGRIRITRNGDVVMFQPNTQADIQSKWGSSKKFTVRQNSGKINFSIVPGRRNRVHVYTQHLAAVVKGTKFSVTVRAGKSKLSVSRGLVGVTERSSGKSTDVSAGKSVSTSSSAGSFSNTTTSGFKSSSNKGSTSGNNDNSNGSGNNGNGNGGGNGNGNGNGGGNNGNGNGGGNNGNGNGNGGGNNGNGNGNGGGNNGNGNGNGGGNNGNGNGNGGGNNGNGNGNGGGN